MVIVDNKNTIILRFSLRQYINRLLGSRLRLLKQKRQPVS